MRTSGRRESSNQAETAGKLAKQLARRLRYFRGQLNLTQEQVAKRAAVGRCFLSALENARAALPRYMTLVRLAASLEVAVADLVCPPHPHRISNVSQPRQS
jgi:transcriptional regulator with XRE-family HTH domain